MAYTNSSLISYSNTQHKNYTSYRAAIKGVVIHHAAGVWKTCKNGCDYFATTDRQVSANYCIGNDGSIGLSTPEKFRAWTTCGYDPDGYNITIEVSNAETKNWTVSDAALKSLINLCADICKRNNIKSLNYTGNKSGNVLAHRWYAATGCPGDYLYGKFGYIATEVNKILNSNTTTTTTTQKPATTTKEIYRIRLSWQDSKTQIGAYSNLESAKKACLAGYTVYDSNGNAVYNVPVNYTYYVRKTFADKKSQLGAYTVLKNAVFFCDKYYGYSVFDQTGKEVHKSGAKLGDINGDDKVDIADARELMRYVTALQKLDDAQKSRADINQDGKIDINDARDLMNKAIKK